MDLASYGFPGEASLRPSERKVAEVLTADPSWFSRATLSEIAARAEVSEPTVVRFARSLGSSGFQDFKYTLIQSLASPLVGVHSLIDESDPLQTVITKTIDASITALTSLRDSLNVDTLSRVADAIGAASELIVLGFGASGIVGQDLAQKFPRLGLPINAPADAQALGPIAPNHIDMQVVNPRAAHRTAPRVSNEFGRSNTHPHGVLRFNVVACPA